MPDAFQVLLRIHRTSVALSPPERFAEALDQHVFRIVYFQSLPQFLVGGTNSLWAERVENDVFGITLFYAEVKEEDDLIMSCRMKVALEKKGVLHG